MFYTASCCRHQLRLDRNQLKASKSIVHNLYTQLGKFLLAKTYYSLWVLVWLSKQNLNFWTPYFPIIRSHDCWNWHASLSSLDVISTCLVMHIKIVCLKYKILSFFFSSFPVLGTVGNKVLATLNNMYCSCPAIWNTCQMHVSDSLHHHFKLVFSLWAGSHFGKVIRKNEPGHGVQRLI